MSRDIFSVCYQASETSVTEITRTIAKLGFKPRLAGEKEREAVPARQRASAKAPEPVASALATARRTNRLVFIDFFAEWCAPCRVLEEIVFPDPEVQKALEGYVFVRVDTDEFPEVGRHFDVAAMPTVLILDERGEELHRLIGMIEAQDLTRLLDALRDSTGKGRESASKDPSIK